MPKETNQLVLVDMCAARSHSQARRGSWMLWGCTGLWGSLRPREGSVKWMLPLAKSHTCVRGTENEDDSRRDPCKRVTDRIGVFLTLEKEIRDAMF